MSGSSVVPAQDSRFEPGFVFRPVVDDIYNENPRRRKRRGRKRGGRKTRPKRRKRAKRNPKRKRRKSRRRNPVTRRYAGGSPKMRYRRRRRWGVLRSNPKRRRRGRPRRRARGRRRTRRRARRNPIQVKGFWPKKTDYTKKNVGIGLGGFFVGLVIPSAVGYAFDYGMSKIDFGTLHPYKPIIKLPIRLILKTGVGMGIGSGLAKITKKPALKRFINFGTAFSVILDIIGTIAKIIIGYQTKATGKAKKGMEFIKYVTPITGQLPQRNFKGANIPIQLLGFGAIADAITTHRAVKAVKMAGNLRVLKNRKTGKLTLMSSTSGPIISGDAKTVMGYYAAIHNSKGTMGAIRSGKNPLGETLTVEAGSVPS